MTMQRDRWVIAALKTMIDSATVDPKTIRRYFSEDYVQIVDGQTLDYSQFIRHLDALKKATKRMKTTILASAFQGDEVFTHHEVAVEKQDGTLSRIQVLAHFSVQAGRIIRCHELTRLIEGNTEDHDLGARI